MMLFCVANRCKVGNATKTFVKLRVVVVGGHHCKRL
jgi:hypothetical protein